MKRVLLAVSVVACGGVAAADPAPSHTGEDPDEAFRAAALALAARDHRLVWTWGPTHIDQGAPARMVRFAELIPQKMDGTSDARGAFLIEQRPGALWLVTYAVRARVTEVELTGEAPPWRALDVRGIHHDYPFFNGHEALDFALRGGTLVVLGYEYDADYRDEFADYIVRPYAKDGCSPHCPALAKFRSRRMGFRVIGPATSIDALVDSEPPVLGLDWSRLALTTDADALAVWRRLALARDQADLVWEIPEGDWRLPLAGALLRSGGFVCPAARMGPICRPSARLPPRALADPCARRELALWSLDVVAAEGAAASVADVLRAIARDPAADGALVRKAVSAAEPDRQLHQQLIGIAWRARPRQRDELLVAIARYGGDTAFLAGLVGGLDEAAARTADCSTAAVIALGLDEQARISGQAARSTADAVLPTAGGAPAMMRALCVLVSYRALGGKTGEPLASFLAPDGLALTWFHHLRYPDDRDRDGDGDPSTRRESRIVPAADVTSFPADLPEAMRNCSDTTCTAARHIYRFEFAAQPAGELRLDRAEIRSRPPCAR
jgi:hypothetical protein